MLTFDATEDYGLLSDEIWDHLKNNYWVLAFRRPRGSYGWEPASPLRWLMSAGEPQKVPNPDMFWRRPTYEEALSRMKFLERCRRDAYSETLRSNNANNYARYRTSSAPPPIRTDGPELGNEESKWR